jgi:hypothetical protein
MPRLTRQPARQLTGMDILEEAAALLRDASAATAVSYLAGAAPFYLGFLYFITDMAHSSFAPERLPVESLALAALFLWKSAWESIFQARLHCELSDIPVPRLKIARAALLQAALQPFALLLVPASFVLTIPFAWTVAFFRNVGLYAAMGESEPVAAARRQAGLWSRQNWTLLSVVSLAALLLFVNVLILILLLPQLGRSFLGIEGDFARLGIGLLNWTTASVAATITWMMIDPILDAAYVVRCFHGESIATAADLRVALRRLTGAAAPLLLALFLATTQTGRAQEAPAQPAAGTSASNAASGGASGEAAAQVGTQVAAIDPERLHQSIEEVIRRPEFAWRAPRPKRPESEGRFAGWARSMLRMARRAVVWLYEQIRRWFPSRAPNVDERSPWIERPPIEFWIALAAILLAGTAVAFYLRRGARRARQPIPTTPAAAAVDLTDESVTADQLPEDSWLQMARDLAAQGDYRLALRALYLAGLNYLGNRKLIDICRWKTGLDYRRELERRMRQNSAIHAEMAPAFMRNVAIFERGWYGRHPVERGDVEALTLGIEEMKRYAR